MHRVRVDQLPFHGIAHQFVGADQGEVGISAYLVTAPPDRGPPPHTHPYDKVVFISQGRARWTVNGQDHEVGSGEILIVKAGEVHSFRSIGEEELVQMDVHLASRFEQHYVT